MYYVDSLHRQHMYGPSNPLLRIMSQVRVHLQVTIHKNVETLGQRFCFQKNFQILVESFWLQFARRA